MYNFIPIPGSDPSEWIVDKYFRIRQDETIAQMIHIYNVKTGVMDSATDFGNGIVINDFNWATDMVNAFFKWRNGLNEAPIK